MTTLLVVHCTVLTRVSISLFREIKVDEYEMIFSYILFRLN